MNLDQPQFILTWDTHAETHTVDSLREKHGKTNLFDDDGVWTNDFQMPDSRGSGCGGYSLLQHVLDNIVHGEQWVCDNCTVVLAGPACKTCGVENTRTGQCGDCSQLGRSTNTHDDWKATLPHDEQEMFQGYQWNEDGTLNKYPGEQDGGAV